jgi:hypothetical protein
MDIKELVDEDTFSRYNQLNDIRSVGLFTYDEQEEWIKLSSDVLYKILQQDDIKEMLVRMKQHD